MDVKEMKAEQNPVNQLMAIMKEQNMGEQSEDLKLVLSYIVGLQVQVGAMAQEMQGIREQLEALQNNQPKSIKSGIQEGMGKLEGKINDLYGKATEAKEHLTETAKQSIEAFKEGGKEKMNQVLQKGISGIQKILGTYRKQVVGVMNDYERMAKKIDGVGNELKQIGNSFANVGRILYGKEAKEVSNQEQGIGLTRAMNKPVKQKIARAEKTLHKIDKIYEKLNKISDSLKPEKENADKASVVGKLSQMKEKAEQQNKQIASPEKKQELCM